MNIALDAIEILSGAVFFICAVLAWGAMSPSTKHCYRLVYSLIGLGGLAMAAYPFCDKVTFDGIDLERIAEVAVLAGFAFYMILDRRRIKPQRAPAPVPVPVAKVDPDPDRTEPGMHGLAALLIFVVAMLAAGETSAGVIAIGESGGVMVTLTNERCALDAVKNLPARATWIEGGKTFEGCYAIFGNLVVGYFEDQTVVLMPAQTFKRADPA